MRISQTAAFANKTYTIDTFPEDPAGESHQVARLDLQGDRFVLEGEIYGEIFPRQEGDYEIRDGFLHLRREGRPDLALEVGTHGPEFFWPGRDIDIEGMPAWQGENYQITLHRVPDSEPFQGSLNAHEENLVGHHQFVAERLGEFQLQLDDDRTGLLVGQLNGQEVSFQGQWMSTYPMSYFLLEGSQDFVSWHNNHDHGNHEHPPGGNPVQDLEDMPVDVIVTTTGERADLRRVYSMVMNPS